MDVLQSTFKQAVSLVEHATQAMQPVPPPSPAEVAQVWLNKMEAALVSKSVPNIVQLFRPDGWWRDMLNIDFDFNTLPTNDIASHLAKFGIPTLTSLRVVDPYKATIVPVNAEVTWLQAFITYETAKTRGKGFVRLRESAPGAGDWAAYTFFTTVWEVIGHEEFASERRPKGADHGEHSGRLNWLDTRKERVNYEKEDPTVLIVGGGQNGLMLSARLTVLGIPCLIVEKNPRLGDSWRNRYYSLCWPIYTPKDKLANWFESYAETMELDVWLSSTIEANPTFDTATGKWTVNVIREGAENRTMHVNHLVLASGFSGEARMPTFDTSEFQGTLCHSSRHKGGMGWEGKNAVVVGCCNSGHDIAADFYERGVNVTIVQRSSTYVMSSEHGIPGLLDGYYQEGGPPLEDADIMLTSLPINLLHDYHVEATKAIAIKDKDLLDSLEAVGFKLNPYPGGLFLKYFRDGGGYYIDVGASTLIAEKKIKLKQGQEIVKLTKDGVLFADGVELKADIVVCATGYSSMRETVRRVISDDVANRIGECWGQDQQGEIPGVWRNSGVPQFWLQCGNMFQARCFSRVTALQIQMIELGMGKSNNFPKYKALKDPRF